MQRQQNMSLISPHHHYRCSCSLLIYWQNYRAER